MNVDSLGCSQKLVVHIGLGKTGTTTLQKHLFPKICELKGIKYNPPEFTKIKAQKLSYSETDKNDLQKVLATQDFLISQEGLVDWNPRNWEVAADRVLDLFGKRAVIVITVRDSVDYLTSIYTQMVHEGNVISPQDFFVDRETYDVLSPFMPQRSLLRFDKDGFDLNYLVSLYKKRFENIYILPLSKLNTLFPWVEVIEINQSDRQPLFETIQNAPRENVSYSKRAMRWTFAREEILRMVGLRSVGSMDMPSNISMLNSCNNVDERFMSLEFGSKVKQLPMRLFKRIYKPWRWWMQTVVDRVLPYEKYRLPTSISFNSSLIKSNNKLIEDAEKNIDEIRS